MEAATAAAETAGSETGNVLGTTSGAVSKRHTEGPDPPPVGASTSCPAAPIPAWARPWNSSCARSGVRRFPGIVLISDGGLNAGASPDTAMELARESHIPIYTVGVGSEKKPVDVRVADFNVPSRVFPGDRYSVEGSIQGYGMKGKAVRVELLAREGAAAKDPSRRGQGEAHRFRREDPFRRWRGRAGEVRTAALGIGPPRALPAREGPAGPGTRVLRFRRLRQISRRRRGRLRAPDARAPCWPAVRCAIISISARCCSAINR